MLLTAITAVRSFSVHMKTAVSDFTPQRLFYTAKAHFLILPIPWLHISMIISVAAPKLIQCNDEPDTPLTMNTPPN